MINSAIPIANLTLGGTKGEIIHFKPSHIRNTSISYTANTPMKPAINFQLFNINSPLFYLITNVREWLKNHDFGETRFCWVTLAQFIRYLKSFYKANLDMNKPLALYVRIFSAKDTLKFLRITYARTHQEVSHKTKLIGLCLLLRLWLLIYTF